MLSTILLALLASSADDAPRGAYVEARTASVFAGACHYGAEQTTQGREAVLALRFDGGAVAGVPLAGVELVAVVAADRNLDDPDAERSSVLLVPRGVDPRARDAARAWLAREHPSVLGEVRAVREVEVSVAVEGDRFAVRAPGVELRGEALPDRACCTMPLEVWYDPLVPVGGAVVGRAEAFRAAAEELERSWSRRGENCAFLGTFGG